MLLFTGVTKMKVSELIEELRKIPPDTEVWIDASTDYEDHRRARGIVTGKGSLGMGGGEFLRCVKGYTAIEIV